MVRNHNNHESNQHNKLNRVKGTIAALIAAAALTGCAGANEGEPQPPRDVPTATAETPESSEKTELKLTPEQHAEISGIARRTAQRQVTNISERLGCKKSHCGEVNGSWTATVLDFEDVKKEENKPYDRRSRDSSVHVTPIRVLDGLEIRVSNSENTTCWKGASGKEEDANCGENLLEKSDELTFFTKNTGFFDKDGQLSEEEILQILRDENTQFVGGKKLVIITDGKGSRISSSGTEIEIEDGVVKSADVWVDEKARGGRTEKKTEKDIEKDLIEVINK